MKHSESIIKIAPALLAIQKELKNTAQTANNPFYNSSYAPLNKILDEVRPICTKYGVIIIQDIKEERGQINVSTMLLHESGEWMQQEGMTLPLERNTPQSAGSAFTYGRRYTISAMLGIATEEDDDGNAGEKPNHQHTQNKSEKEEIIEIKEGGEIPKGYWELSNELKRTAMPKGCKATKIEGVWVALKQGN